MPLDANHDNTFRRSAMKAELLDAQTEHALAVAWRDRRDEAALHRLITAYMRLAVSMAAKYRRYGASMNDLTQEASVGLMKAAEKFDPDRGVRFSTYAMWWIKASIQEFVMRNWSMVRTGSTSAQKSLFFNMRRVQAQLERAALASGSVLDHHELLDKVAVELGVPIRDVEMMDGRLTGADFSLNATQSSEEEGREWIDTLVDDAPPSAEMVAHAQDMKTLKSWVGSALEALSTREQLIIRARKLADEPRTLESLGQELSLSKERVRQLEAAALDKMRSALESNGPDLRALIG